MVSPESLQFDKLRRWYQELWTCPVLCPWVVSPVSGPQGLDVTLDGLGRGGDNSSFWAGW